ncbi:hypothetical protein SEVIR_6G239100v4 [Setaria viridis]|uniref:Uncharacterized protein n=2 Tax=Setaria viridis TaxID=4556 RepID=A0A4U6UD42_SETVI|nr:uncharacterized protein LOC117860229 isoform X2 [Setaria viridis]XP_034599380.1 uncharacterized protein LOC117860229 isoform X2 [Setaria viridis]TKW11549.1 hypothetical protein SEVIR_6G239100v2 [Setaria viridis]
MNRVRRIAGIGKAKVPSAVQKDRDESIVFFRELYKREKDKDVNLLEPMYSVEFEAIQGGHGCKVPPGKRDFLIPVDEKHDYDWLMTPPAAPLFPSLEIEANSSQMVFQRVPIPTRQVKPSAPRLLAKPEATKASARPASPTSNSSSRKTFIKGAPAISKEKKQPHTAGQRSDHKVPVNGHQKAAAAVVPAGTRTSGAPKKHSERCYATQTGGTSATKGVTDQETPFKAPKNLITTTRSIFRRRTPSAENARSKDPGSGADVKKENGKARRQSYPPPAIRGMTELQLQDRRDALPPRGKSVAGSGGELATGNGGRAGRASLMKGTGRTDGRAWI